MESYERTQHLGVDAGSVSLAVVVLDATGSIVKSYYSFHNGQIIHHLHQALQNVDLSLIKTVGYTSSTPAVLKTGRKTDSHVAFIRAAKFFHAGLRSLLIIGAEKFGLVSFDENGNYLNLKSNTSCAAGTGNFLDQQAERLNLKSIEEFSAFACSNTGSVPLIASRCSVFAKTDLIHVQQEGYSLAEICDGLAFGLARNIADALAPVVPLPPLVAAGGVALNRAVIRHIEKFFKTGIIVDEYAHLYGAAGAALESMANGDRINEIFLSSDIVEEHKPSRALFYPPLKTELTRYPDFTSLRRYEFHSRRFPEMKPVETDIYLYPRNSENVYLGIDIGSTSTKAVLMNEAKEILAGLYTRTAGQPLRAVQCIFEAINDIQDYYGAKFVFLGAGTTGSGRKFIGRLLNADMVLDEITAHARAAFELDPETDTIIEIGGQDSKFTLMKNGGVTFSVMNNVCAAGTGSFIEEQARRLNCPLSEYSERAMGSGAPLTSDRCTVFMERDLNHFLNAGYSSEEILAAVLHATRENYLAKVAREAAIGKKIFFQGATAKNKALVAAFEMKLGKPIMVSKYCHLTGALGVALELHDAGIKNTKFRGIEIYKKDIPVTSEICRICTNHCKLKIARIDDETEAYGFLCGRDYHTPKYVRPENAGLGLIQKRKEIFRYSPVTRQSAVTIGLPDALHLSEELPFWQKFFDLLHIRTVSSREFTEARSAGKNICGAEFCAPVAAMHGHVKYLLEKCDFVFLPYYFQDDYDEIRNKQYCYYTQFISSVISVSPEINAGERILAPLLRTRRGGLHVRLELQRMFRKAGLDNISLMDIARAYTEAQKHFRGMRRRWKNLFDKNPDASDIHIVILGRPYTVLLSSMNSNIPEIIENNRVRVYYMDMLPGNYRCSEKTDELLKTIKWKYASKILQAADYIAQKKHCYPVLVTSFKCTPDAFVVEYFKEVMNNYGKPYLILQLDEHDSTVGYETRIEAALRTFRNHSRQMQKKTADAESPAKPVVSLPGTVGNRNQWNRYLESLLAEARRIISLNAIDVSKFKNPLKKIRQPVGDFNEQLLSIPGQLKNKTLLLPSWDRFVGSLLEAVLINAGVDARLVDSPPESMVRSLSHNTGQCIPLNIIVQNCMDYIENKGLNPADTVIWNIDSNLSCNISMFPYFMQKLLNDRGGGMEKVSVYLGDVIFYDFSLQTAINAYLAYMFGGNVRKIGCMLRPYELEKGRTDQVIRFAMDLLYEVFKSGADKEPAVKKIVEEFSKIPVRKTPRPKVAIFGDLYVRDNDMMNQNLIQVVEENGGEVVTTSYSEYLKIIADPSIERSYREGRYLEYAKYVFLKSLIPLVEGKFNRHFSRFIKSPLPVKPEETRVWLEKFQLTHLHRGESLENILKIYSLVKNYPELDLFIQTNPSYCCPSLVTEAMTERIEELTGIPVVSIEYDGTQAPKNEIIIPYLKFRKKRKAAATTTVDNSRLFV